MEREQIIRMAREAGWDDHHAQFDTRFQTFAALVASAERERIAKKIEQLPFGDTSASFAIFVREDA